MRLSQTSSRGPTGDRCGVGKVGGAATSTKNLKTPVRRVRRAFKPQTPVKELSGR